MRLASYNIEWMNGLFKDNHLQLDDQRSARENATRKEQAIAIADVLRMINADLFLILEAPNEANPGDTVKALENFAANFSLRQNTALMGHASGTDQEIALLFDPKIITAHFEPYAHPDAPAFDHKFTLNLPGATHNSYEFSKPPLETQIIHQPSNFAFRLIGAHLKSKAPHGASNDQEAQQISFENRRKQIAQATWIRKRIDHMHFPFIVAGDFNDGPGMDDYEAILGQSSIDILTQNNKLYDPSLKNQDKHTTSRFYNHEDQSYKEALLDFIFVSKEMRPFARSWRIWHPLQDRALSANPKWRDALLTASDHFPVSLDLVFKEEGA